MRTWSDFDYQGEIETFWRIIDESFADKVSVHLNMGCLLRGASLIRDGQLLQSRTKRESYSAIERPRLCRVLLCLRKCELGLSDKLPNDGCAWWSFPRIRAINAAHLSSERRPRCEIPMSTDGHQGHGCL